MKKKVMLQRDVVALMELLTPTKQLRQHSLADKRKPPAISRTDALRNRAKKHGCQIPNSMALPLPMMTTITTTINPIKIHFTSLHFIS